MSAITAQNEIENQVRAHIDRLKDRVNVTQNKMSIASSNIDPQFVAEDNIALDQVNHIIINSTFKKKLCAGLGNISSDLEQLAKPLVKVLFPVSAIKSGGSLLGYNWTFDTLPIGVLGASVLAIYMARFGIGYFCGDQET